MSFKHDHNSTTSTVPRDASFPRGLVNYGSLTIPTRYHLSPLAGFTNLPFRRIVRDIGGVGLVTTDLVNARSLMEGTAKAYELIETCAEERPFAVQIFGHDPQVMADAAQLLEGRGVDSIDINMGCPVDRITNVGAGSKLMCDPNATLNLVRSVVEAVKLPVTVKMRLGWDDKTLTAPKFAREFEQVGVTAIAIHGRTREQGFSGTVNRDGIRQVVEAVERIPVIGNGDIRNVADAATMFRDTGCPIISIGRGALANPWIFRQLIEWEQTGQFSPAGTFNDRMQLLRVQLGYLMERFGEEKGIIRFRKMAHWYLKSMRVKAKLRHEYQVARTLPEVEAALALIREAGPLGASPSGVLPDMHVPVPSGPVERW
ncbi:tRNA dihydrouridine synthase DusB [Calycomorphotria hydatis]|uniref:tRNA-dihydrouridine synthase n=1 Tax=Calycomorphotria hydatis TaxID=2528027 RepID=A0A517TCB5_9PLAN|nr:tRNA dihydrouridine synthase DusB [Calycomorphotria hydatis]QDT65990.1 tRNA-dihydrouridine synthase C [Calycomorphotria hydatis]